jgi:arginine decarboxylase
MTGLAFYAGYEESDREHLLLGEAARRLAEGKSLVSTTFIVPYPPGFPVLVPGRVISKEILYSLALLDVTEIHGYNPDLGILVFTEGALKRLTADRPEQPERLGSTADRSSGFGSRA